MWGGKADLAAEVVVDPVNRGPLTPPPIDIYAATTHQCSVNNATVSKRSASRPGHSGRLTEQFFELVFECIN